MIKENFSKRIDLSSPKVDSGDSAKQLRAVWVEVDAFMKYASDLRRLSANRILM